MKAGQGGQARAMTSDSGSVNKQTEDAGIESSFIMAQKGSASDQGLNLSYPGADMHQKAMQDLMPVAVTSGSGNEVGQSVNKSECASTYTEDYEDSDEVRSLKDASPPHGRSSNTMMSSAVNGANATARRPSLSASPRRQSQSATPEMRTKIDNFVAAQLDKLGANEKFNSVPRRGSGDGGVIPRRATAEERKEDTDARAVALAAAAMGAESHSPGVRRGSAIALLRRASQC